jgi:N-acetylglucosaminyl-diphospho-decaprenol L-rhamnosyltransferase
LIRSERVTVSVLTYNRAAELAVTLRRILEGCGGAPVLVVDNGSTDGTPEVVRSFAPRVRHVRLSHNQGAAGRNTGVLLAQTPYVALCDDDTWWAPGSLARAADALDDHAGLAIVTARVLVGPGQREDPTCAEMANSPLGPAPDLPGSPILGFLAGASMVRRRAFLDAGGFEPRFFLGGEERLLAVDLASRGWSMVYVADAVVHHHPSRVRDTNARRELCARNALWFTWLRRPWRSALGETARVLRRAAGDGAVLRGALRALAGLPWVARRRHVVPLEIERALRLVA